MNTLFPAICFLAFAYTLYFVSCAVNSDVQKYIDLQRKNCNNKTAEFIKCKKRSSFGYNTKEVLANCKGEQASSKDNPNLDTLCKQLKSRRTMGMQIMGLNEAYFNCTYEQINNQTYNNATGAIENSRLIIERCLQEQLSSVEDDSM